MEQYRRPSNDQIEKLRQLLCEKETTVRFKGLDRGGGRRVFLMDLMDWASRGREFFLKEYGKICGPPDDISPFGNPVYMTDFKEPVNLIEWVISGMSQKDQSFC